MFKVLRALSPIILWALMKKTQRKKKIQIYMSSPGLMIISKNDKYVNIDIKKKLRQCEISIV